MGKPQKSRTITPAQRIALVLRTNTKSAIAFCLEVQKNCQEFSLPAVVIAEYLEHNPSLKASPHLISKRLDDLALNEIKRIARVLKCNDTKAREFCVNVQKAFRNKTISLKSIAECVEQIESREITLEIVVAKMGGTPLDPNSLKSAPRTKKGKKRSKSYRAHSNQHTEAIKKRNGDWEKD